MRPITVRSANRGRRHGWIELLALAALLSGSSPSFSAGWNQIALRGVPYVAQLPNYCGPAALSSLLAYWGSSVPQTTIARRVFDRKYGATNGADLLLYAQEEGFSAFTCFSTLDEVKLLLRAGIPALTLSDMSRRDHRGHFRVVVGYNDTTREILFRDPNYEEIRRMSYKEFNMTWEAFGRWALIVCPKEDAIKLPNAVRENPVYHLDLGIAFLRRNRTEQARANFMETLRLEPQNEEAKDMLDTLNRHSPSS